MYKVKIWKDPHEAGFDTTKADYIELKEGITILVGCNGAGKTTLLNNIRSEVKEPLYHYNNLSEGNSSALSKAFFESNVTLGATLFSSSEGESIIINLGQEALKFKEFLKTGKVRKDMADDLFTKIFDVEEDEVKSNKRFFLFDAIDSGLSIDMVDQIRSLFSLVCEDAKKMGVELYIIASCNEYELARDNQCLDVISGKYVEINSYEDFRKVILKSSEEKEKR